MGLVQLVRDTFAGITDKYLNWSQLPNEFVDVTGTFFQDHLRDMHVQRLNRYKRHWGFYRGEHFSSMTTEGARKFVANYCKLVVDKSVNWLVTNSFKLNAPPGNEAILPALNLVWDTNMRDSLMWEHSQTGAVTGDGFLYPTIVDVDEAGKPLPLEQQRLVIVNLDPAYVYPVYNLLTREMTECLIQFPSLTNANIANISHLAVGRQGVYSVHITPKVVTHYWNKDKIRETENVFGDVNVAHTRNLYLSNSIFGLSDLDGIIELNEEYNQIGHEIGDIIKYHAAPTTLIFGARASQLERGANKIISGLPKDAKVENLVLESDLKATMDHHKGLKQTIAELSSTPESVWGSMDKLPSNTSGVALEVQWLPLIEKTKLKHISYGATIQRVNSLLLRVLQSHFKLDFASAVKTPSSLYTTVVEFVSPIPQDEKAKIDLVNTKVTAGLQSQAGAIREIGERDPDRTMIEIQADKIQQMAEDIERARAPNTTTVPNVALFGLGSLAMNSDGIREMVAEAAKEADSKNEEIHTQEMADQKALMPPPAPAAVPIKRSVA